MSPQQPEINGPWFLWKLLIDERHKCPGYGLEVVQQIAELAHATELSEAVNQCIFVEAKKIANATDEIQNPPQIYRHHTEHDCPTCAGSRGSKVVHLGTAVAVIPTARWQEFRDFRWPPRDT